MSKNQRGFTVVEGLLVTVLLAAVIFIGWYALDAKKKAESNLDQTVNTSTASSTQLNHPSQNELIDAAVNEYNQAAIKAGTEVTINSPEVNNENVKGSVKIGGIDNTYIAHRTQNKWEVVFQGQELPGKDIGLKYNLPASWYSKD
jgi:competence protein ComGC